VGVHARPARHNKRCKLTCRLRTQFTPKPATSSVVDAQTARRVDAEIAKLMMEAEKFGEERRKKLHEEGNKLRAEAAKMTREILLYPLVIGAGLIGAGAALFGTLIKMLP